MYLCQYHIVLITIALQYCLTPEILIPPAPFFFLRIALAIWGVLCYHTNFKMFCSSSVKNVLGNLIGIALNLQLALSNIVILTIWILPIQEHGVSFHLFVSLISFISVLQFPEYRSFVSLGRFIPRHFFFFDVMVNGMVSLISLPDLSLLVCRNEIDFCVLILYPATFPNSERYISETVQKARMKPTHLWSTNL